jgi:5-formyltetrahydrofolate cyclo-ligase
VSHPPAVSLGAAARKVELRRLVLARRDGLGPVRRAELSARIFARVLDLEAFRTARTVLAYHSFGSEPVTAPLLREVLRRGQVLGLPRVNRQARALDLYRVRDPDRDLVAGVWGIREPDPARCPPLAVEAPDFVLVPGVAFDARGGRIGYGAGYYDRLLGRCSAGAALVAAAFEVQLVDEVPWEPHDRRVDRVVTERCIHPEEPRARQGAEG